MSGSDGTTIAKNALENYSLNLQIMAYVKSGKKYDPEDLKIASNELKIVQMTRAFYELCNDYDALNIIDKMYASAISVSEYSEQEHTSRTTTYRKIEKILETAARLCATYDYEKFSTQALNLVFCKRNNSK